MTLGRVIVSMSVLGTCWLTSLGVVNAADAVPVGRVGPSSTDVTEDDPDFTNMVNEAIETVPELSKSEARRRVAAQETRHQIVDDAIKEVGDDGFGGARYSLARDVLTVYSTTSKFAEVVGRNAESAGLQVETPLVDDSVSDLLAEQRSLATRLFDGKGAVTGLDIGANEVVLRVSPEGGDKAKRYAEASDVDIQVIVAEPSKIGEVDVCVSISDCGKPIRSGIKIFREDGQYCSMGFGVANSNGGHYITTAGHCGPPSTESTTLDEWFHKGYQIGSMVSRCWDCSGHSSVDVGVISIIGSFWQSTALGYMYNYASPDNAVTLNLVPYNNGSLFEGDIVCIKGVHAGEISDKCGTLADVSDSGNGGKAKVTGYDACGGDSGGAWFSTSQAGQRIAYGMHSESNVGCHGDQGGNASWFTTTSDWVDQIESNSGSNQWWIYLRI